MEWLDVLLIVLILSIGFPIAVYMNVKQFMKAKYDAKMDFLRNFDDHKHLNKKEK